MIKKWIREALTKTTIKPSSSKTKRLIIEEIPPSERLVWAVTFSIAALGCLTALEVTYLLVKAEWNSEIFAAITSLIGTIIGIFLGAKA